QIEQEQSAKAQTLSPDVPTPLEKHFDTGEKNARKIFQDYRVHLQVGGLSVPSGFAVGPVVTWQNANDTVRWNSWAVGSVRQYYSAGTTVELPRFSGRNIDVTLSAGHRDMPQLDFYGVGPNSLKSNRTDYRMEDTRLAFGVAWPVLTHVKPLCDAEQLFLNVGPGTNDGVTCTEQKFGAARAP